MDTLSAAWILVVMLHVLSVVAEPMDLKSIVTNGAFDINLFKCNYQHRYVCPHQDIDYVLYTPRTRNGHYVSVHKPMSFDRGGFQRDKETAFIVHGFNGSHLDTHMRYLRDAYLSRDFNVVMVSWTRVTFYPCYLSAVSNTKLVGQCTAQVYAHLTHLGHNPNLITCIGHSLGAHICGMVSTHLTRRQHRIIGLDPAKPIIEFHAPKTFRLTRDDAEFVQIIHTNAGTLGQISFTGKLDLCINGGKVQPFCHGNPIRIARCSHFLSVCYLANAIFKHKLFPFVPCPKGCRKKGILGSLFGHKKPSTGMSKMMHIGQDVPKDVSGAYCVRVDFAKHCPFND